MKTLAVFDLDGTLADAGHRLHFINPMPPRDPETGKKRKKNFKAFHDACDQDGVFEDVAFEFREGVADPDITVIILTGRPEAYRSKTERWLEEKGLTGYDELIMKSGDQSVPDFIQKAKAADEIEERHGMSIDIAYDDRKRIINMWKERGTYVVDVIDERKFTG